MSARRLRKSEFARLLGVAPSYVTKLAKAGRLVLCEDGRVDVEASLARIEATRDPARQDVARRHAAARAAKAAVPPPRDADPEPDAAPASYAEARALKERYAALTAPRSPARPARPPARRRARRTPRARPARRIPRNRPQGRLRRPRQSGARRRGRGM